MTESSTERPFRVNKGRGRLRLALAYITEALKADPSDIAEIGIHTAAAVALLDEGTAILKKDE